MKKKTVLFAFLGENAFSEKSKVFAGLETEVEETVKILFIGNSFTYVNDIPELFRQIASAAGKSVTVESITHGAHNLSKFADPADEYGAQVADALAACSDYGIIVLQEQSTRLLQARICLPTSTLPRFLASIQGWCPMTVN